MAFQHNPYPKKLVPGTLVLTLPTERDKVNPFFLSAEDMAEFLRELMNDKGISVSELASVTGVTEDFINEVESGQFKNNVISADKVFSYFRVKPSAYTVRK